MERSEKIERAKELGCTVKGNISNDALDEMLEDAELAAKEAQYEKPSEESKKTVSAEKGKAGAVKAMTEMVIAKIIPLDERMRDLPSEMYCVGTKNGFKKQVVKFGEFRPVYKVIVDMLKEKTALIQSKHTGAKGQDIVRKVMSEAFAITERELTAEEIAELTKK